ncbi:MAG TPA: carbamoyltransferase HypF [Streptosporangiaceae bacterium]|nr:carbamoyltransferase HypF [Streptosporangiaceae bacterium]
MTGRIRTAVRVEGIVQGVGFRPFVYSLATGLGLGGLVGNDPDGVFAEVEGDSAAVREFLVLLEQQAPPLARIERVTTTRLRPTGSAEFVIAASEPAGPAGAADQAAGRPRRTLISADTATCADCLAELADPADRRFGYAFINCTNCGPRFTIVRDVPYDRALTTMSGFAMCAPCAAEYHDPADRRFHAQPVCCPDCGPRLRLLDSSAIPLAAPAPASAPAGADTALIAAAAALLRDGRVLAVKGLGGYHLAALAGDETAVGALRGRKHREDKPFAVMVPGLAAARQLCEVDDAAAQLLTSARRPIVLLPRRPGGPAGTTPGIAPSVAPGNRQLGIMLPYTPLHHLLLRELAAPIVLTSGNVSDEPIAYRDADAVQRLAGIADAFLTHDRAIHIRTDDSVVRSSGGRESVLRRSRGYVPEPLPVPVRFARPVLACGAELKSTFCLGIRGHAFVSHHIGDLENAETLRSFTEGIAHFRRLFDIEPQLVAHDLHPDYLSTKHAAALDGIELLGVQHHHAHIASCLADNGETGPVIGVAFDGTGYGSDATIWGGEFLIADLAGFERAGYFEPVPMPGGAAAIRQPWRMAASYLAAAYPGGPPAGLQVMARQARRWPAVLAMASRGINSPVTSSAGRLFDAVAAVLGVRDEVSYEGQAAIELEQLADVAEPGAYPAAVTGDAPLRVAGADLVRAAADDLAAGTGPPVIAARFHNGVAAVIERACAALRDRHGLSVVALSGGVFQNLLLTDRVVSGLTARGFRVLVHHRVPCNDGGISLGQAAVAAARDQAS